jgi:cobalt-zinc-cadmium efflux system membrane fusion protein
VKYRHRATCVFGVAVAASLVATGGCEARGAANPADEAPPAAVVEHESDGRVVHVAHPEQFALVTAEARRVAPTLTATGVVSPDVSRAVPVVSLVSGRVVQLRVRLGDRVHRGEVLLRVQSADVSSAAADYRKARADEALARSQLDRATDLYARGAIARKDLEVAQDTAEKATVDVENDVERLRVLGVDPARAEAQSGFLDVVAPVSGVITEQNVTDAAGVRTLDNSPNLLTISDLSHVWVVCDVYENDVPAVHVGDTADIELAAYPGHPLKGAVSNIGAVLDPNLRTAKVRIEVANPGMLRVGMFATVTFHDRRVEVHAAVPSSAILHLRDRDWVYVPTGRDTFEQRRVVSGQLLAGGLQEVASGVEPGQRVVGDALVLENAASQ